MARMIPPKIHPAVKSGAERRLFDLIRDEPGTDDWICLHSLGLSRHEVKRRAEIDFLLLTRLGIFVIEVKGGRVSRRDGVWFFTNRWDQTVSKTESPFDQASSAMFALEAHIREHFSDGERRQQRLLFGFGAMFPDCPIDDLAGTEIDPRQLYDRDSIQKERQTIRSFVEQLAAFWRERSSLGDNPARYAPTEKDLEEILAFLRGDFDLVPSIGAIADDSRHQMHALEAEQYLVLDAMEVYPDPRLIVQGGAGTGKTLLAAEVAYREAMRTEGTVLLLCFNRVLAGVLEHNVKPPPTGKIVVKSIHSLLFSLIEAAPCHSEFQEKRCGMEDSNVYSELVPEFGFRALLETEFEPYAALVVDEAQDMLSMVMLDVLDGLVKKGLKEGRWWFFCDRNNQASVFGVYEDAALFRLMGLGHVSILPTNRRNTIPIANETEIVTRPQFPPHATVDGIPVKTRWYRKTSEQRQALSSILKSLINEDISPHQITILSPRKVDDCCAASLTDFPMERVNEENGWKVGSTLLNKVTYCTVSSFKGLENDFIVLTDIDELAPEWWRGVVYVGMSRARTGLYLLFNNKLKPILDERQQMWLRDNVAKQH